MTEEYVETMIWTKLDNCKGDLPGLRTCSSFVVMDNKLYLYGGGLWSSEEQRWINKYNDLVVFDTEQLEWRKVVAQGQPPGELSGVSSCNHFLVMATSVSSFVIGRCLYIYGGTCDVLSVDQPGGHIVDTIVCGDLYSFDTLSCTWDKVLPLNPQQLNQRGRDCATASALDNMVYIYGGNYSFFYGNEQDFCVLRIAYPYYRP